jgi:hypothetical protein
MDDLFTFKRVDGESIVLEMLKDGAEELDMMLP